MASTLTCPQQGAASEVSSAQQRARASGALWRIPSPTLGLWLDRPPLPDWRSQVLSHLAESTVQIRAVAAAGLCDLVAMGTAGRWKRIRYRKL